MAKTNRLSLGTLIQIFAAAALLATSACKRAGDEISSFSIKIPTAEQLSSKNSVQSVVDYNLLCFAIDIQGGSIPSTSANTCQPVKGQMLGSVAPGQTLQGRINEGTYTFKVYALKRTNAAQACPAVTADSWNFPLAKVYYAGETANQKIAGETANIELQITLPDESTNMIAHNSFPATCNLIGAPAQSTAGKNSRIVMGSGGKISAETAYILHSRIHYKEVTKEMTGSFGKKIKNWKAGPL